MAGSAIEVFISYSHKDEALRQELDSHLKILERTGHITAWHDRKIEPGAEWDREISTYLERADLILLLVSANFLASDFCWNIEIDRAIKRHEAGEAIVVPIILRPVDWKEAPFSKLQAMPKNAKPVVTWAPQDQAFADIAKGLRQLAQQLKAARQAQQTQTQQQAALEQYRQKVEAYLADGELSFIERENLQDLAAVLDIAPTQAEGIINQALKQRQAYDNNLERYRQSFQRALEHEFQLSEATKAALKERQALLGLKDTDVEAIESAALADREAGVPDDVNRAATASDDVVYRTATSSDDANRAATIPLVPSTDTVLSGKFFTERIGNKVDLELVKIPAGQFLMGSPDNEAERYGDEGPQHLVTVPEFWMGKYPVTQAQWTEVAALPKVEVDLEPSPSCFKGADLPVEQVNWHQANEFCQRLSQATGRNYGLPSEAEWECACRAGTTTRYYFGDSITGDQV
ncbi:MAG: SUMF1/EgtB/PvdO family nonheme iron enzyme, partial [Cyanobacteria bacterium P01_F01_bin.86]